MTYPNLVGEPPYDWLDDQAFPGITNHQRRAMRIHSSHVVSIDVEIPEGAFVSSRDNPFDRKNSLIIKAKSHVSVEDAKEILLEAVRAIVESIDGVQLMVVS